MMGFLFVRCAHHLTKHLPRHKQEIVAYEMDNIEQAGAHFSKVAVLWERLGAVEKELLIFWVSNSSCQGSLFWWQFKLQTTCIND